MRHSSAVCSSSAFVRTAAAVAVLAWAAGATTVAAQNLTVDVSQTYQTMDGMGTNINVDSWKGGELKSALDELVDRNGCSLLRVVRDRMDWVTAEADIPLLHSLDPATLTRIYEAPLMQDIWNTIGYLNQKGVRGNRIMLNFMGWTPVWLGGSGGYGSASYITAGKEGKLATMIASLVYYGRKVKGLDFTVLAPLNEPDLDGIEGPLVGPSQNVTILKALIAELDAMGLTDIRLVGPDTAGDGGSYISAMMADATVRARVDHLAFHKYDAATSPGTSYSGKNYWLTESALWCPSCGSTSPQSLWSYARNTNDVFLQDVANGFASVLMWQGHDGFWYHHNEFDNWALEAYDSVAHTYTPRKGSYVNAQLTAFIRPGAKRVSVSKSLGNLTAVAFYDSAKGEVAIVGLNKASSSVTINGRFTNLPVTLSTLVLYETSASQSFQRGADVPVAGQSFTVSIPADTFFSLGNIAAGPGPSTYTLTVAKAGTGTGTVTSSPAGISCGADCSEAYSSGTVVALTASAAGGSTFSGWSGACTGTGSCSVTMDAAKSVTATFTLISAPQVTSISPMNGPVTGGTAVTIRGSGFVAGATVGLGGVAATGVVVADSTRITAVTGAHATGLVDVTVTVPGPLSGTLAQGFFYAPLPVPTGYFTVSPCRLVDTRTTAQAPALAAGERRVWTITSRCALPATANAVALNVTVTAPTARGYIRLAPGNGLTESSTLNFVPGVTRANNAIVTLATDGTGGVAVTNGSTGTVHVVLDVAGYFE